MFLTTNDGGLGQPLLFTPPGDDAQAERGWLSARPIEGVHSRSPSPRQSRRQYLAPPPTSRPALSRSSTMRSQSPGRGSHARLAARKKYTYAAMFLVVSLVSFTIQTELAAHIQTDLGWDKAYCMLYLTHGSWALLWPAQLVVLRLHNSDVPWRTFWRRHVWLLRTTAQTVERQDLVVDKRHGSGTSPWPYLVRTTALITVSLTVAGLSWYVAVNKTTPGDLTAIYNCSAFFAYAFSVPLLKERLRLDKSLAVAVAMIGVVVVAYGDSRGAGKTTTDSATRLEGNLIIGVGSVLYGLYEVLYKRLACPPEGTSAGRATIFANSFGSLVGLFTLLVLWVPLPVLHVLGWETFALPTGRTAWLLLVSVVMNATFAGSFLVLISLTSPVLSSVSALLTIFIVAVVDWAKGGDAPTAAALAGGCLIVAAFAVLSWSTWREMAEDERKREMDMDDDDDEDDESDDHDDGDGVKRDGEEE